MPASGAILKYHCPDTIDIDIKNNGPYDYSTFSSVLKFSGDEVSITHNSISSFFSTMPNGYVDGNLYFAM
jgi:hypothetical protein